MEDQAKTLTPSGANTTEPRRTGRRKKEGQADEGVVYVLATESTNLDGIPDLTEKFNDLQDAALEAFIRTKSGKPCQLFSMQKLEVVTQKTDTGYVVTAEPAK